MQIPAWLMGGVIVAGIAGYYWYSFGRHGGMNGYQKHQFKLREGETVLKYFHGGYHLDNEKKDIALALVNVERVGKPLHFAITSQGRLIFRENAAVMADEPISLEKNEVKAIKILEGEYPTQVGLTGKLEKTRAVEIHLTNGQLIKVRVPQSGAEAMKEWAE